MRRRRFPPLSRIPRERGVALIIVLALVVILTGVIIAFFSRSIATRQISDTSANQTGADILAQGAANTIIADLQQEIVAGSLPVASGSLPLYYPSVPQNAVPQLSGTGPLTGVNLVKRSASGVPFFSGSNYKFSGPSRAAAVSTGTLGTSLNGRYISLGRWNEPLMVSGTATDFTPDLTGSLLAPDWILISRSGTNPTTFNANLTYSSTNSSSVVGRYAYNIYNEGGLLDMNVAGYPAATGTFPSAFNYKDALAMADLTQLVDSSSNQILTQQQINQIVGWRNYGTLQPTGSFPNLTLLTSTSANALYASFITANANGFLRASGTAVFNSQSNHLFGSRQELIKFLLHGIGTSTTRPELQKALQYMSTFNRSLNQPSYYPDPTRPMVVGPAATTTSTTSGVYYGGNSAYQPTDNPPNQDNIYNPQFKSIQVISPFTRADGSTAVVGEPLVKKRFALSRLCWLTYKGPSATLSTTDPLYTAYINLGVSPSLLAEGGTANIQNYFGLTWAPLSSGAGGYWYYNHGLGYLGALADVQKANRDPDFFELLQAAINVGSYAKAGISIGSTTYTVIQDSNLSPQIMQLGANIIDEANPTQYPTHIVYNIAASGAPAVYRSAYGVMDLPYLSSVANVRFIVATPASPATTNTPQPTGTSIPVGSPSKGLYSVANGTGAFIQVPCIWNMFDVNGPAPVPALSATNLRITVASALPTLNGNLTPTGSGGWPDSTSSWSLGPSQNPLTVVPTCDYSGTSVGTAPSGAQLSGDASPTGTFVNNWTSEASTALDFSNDTPSQPNLYREPTALMRQAIPAGSNLKIESGSSIIATNSRWTAGVPEMNGANPPNMQFIGFFGTTYPLQWTQAATGGSAAYYAYVTNELIPGTMPASGVTVRLEYQSGSTWIPYMEYNCSFQYTHDFVPLNEAGTYSQPFELLPNTGSAVNTTGTSAGSMWNENRNGSPGGGLPGEMVVTDPRSQSWGFPVDEGPSRNFIDGTVNGTGPATDEIETQMPTNVSSSAETSHSFGGNMIVSGFYEPTGGVVMGLKQINKYSGPPTTPSADYYADPDGTVRRGVGAYVSGTANEAGNIDGISSGPGWVYTASTGYGLPLCSATAYSATTSGTTYTPVTGQSQSRPIILHRPYRSVAELGYVYSNTPWKNIDFFTPESGYSALLDTFCINEDTNPTAEIAGRVDLNTRQVPVLQAILSGAYRDAEAPSTSSLSATEAALIAQALVTRTTVGPATGPNANVPQPLFNIADLVGRWIKGITQGSIYPTEAPLDGSTAYDGFTRDLGIYLGSPVTTNNTPTALAGTYNILQRFREATIRALANTGQAGTWNLMIDVIAQTGRYPESASNLTQFVVEGERRFWVHVAIDRETGAIIDKSVESVNE